MTGRLHPKVYAALVGLAAWFAAWVWSFAGGGETDYLLFIVSAFIAIVVALQLIMSRVARVPDDAANEAAKPPSFRAWLRGAFDTEQGRLSGAEAATLILLPIAAAAIGMMAFGIVFQIVEHAGT